MNKTRWLLIVLLLLTGVVFAQSRFRGGDRSGRGGGRFGGGSLSYDNVCRN